MAEVTYYVALPFVALTLAGSMDALRPRYTPRTSTSATRPTFRVFSC
jgi:hypothetical protein